MSTSFTELLARVPEPSGDEPPGTFWVQAIPNAPRNYIGRNVSGQPCLLLGSTADRPQAPIHLAAIEARFGVACQISPADGQPREELLTVVTCTTQETQIQTYFLHICETIVRIVGPSPSQGRVIEAVQRLIDLFQRLARPSSRSVLGLIGELYVIARSRDAAQAVRAWRSSDNDCFDFSLEDLRMEVKASSERVRIHYLSADQCRPPLGTVGVLVSLFIESTGGGTSVDELIRMVEGRLAANDDLVLKLQETVAETLGDALPIALARRFDERLARASIQLYDLNSVPGIREDIPVEVTQVRFRSDLSLTPTLMLRELTRRNLRAVGVLPKA